MPLSSLSSEVQFHLCTSRCSICLSGRSHCRSSSRVPHLFHPSPGELAHRPASFFVRAIRRWEKLPNSALLPSGVAKWSISYNWLGVEVGMSPLSPFVLTIRIIVVVEKPEAFSVIGNGTIRLKKYDFPFTFCILFFGP